MSHPIVTPVSPADFAGLLPLLQTFDAPKMTRADWLEMLFFPKWRRAGDPWGYGLRRGHEFVGFIGTIYAHTEVGGRPLRLCNLSSWVVRPAYRSHALALMHAALSDRGATYTSLTLIEASVRLFRRAGFQTLEESALLLPLTSAARGGATRATPVFARAPRRKRMPGRSAGRRSDAGRGQRFHSAEEGVIGRGVDGDAREVFSSHRETRARHFWFRNGERSCYVLCTRWRLRHLPWSQVHYVSDPDFFRGEQGSIQRFIQRKMHTWGLLIDRRVLPGPPPRWAIPHRLPQPRLYRPAEGLALGPREVSGLYSEFMYLNT